MNAALSLISVRPARPSDAPAVRALVAREVRAGTVLPRLFSPGQFLVAEDERGICGTVSLSAWTSEVVELGTLIAREPGRGIGALLARAALDEALARGHGAVVALTAVPGFFLHLGFSAVGDTPWARARGIATLPATWMPELAPAVGYKATKGCASCPRLAGCQQVLLAIRIGAAARVCA